jgi:hypothetical protein
LYIVLNLTKLIRSAYTDTHYISTILIKKSFPLVAPSILCFGPLDLGEQCGANATEGSCGVDGRWVLSADDN